MKAITANSINADLEADKKTLMTRNITAREVIFMNLFSNIMIKDNEIRKSNIENKRTSMNQDNGFNLYKALEFSKDMPSKAGHSRQMEMICNKLI